MLLESFGLTFLFLIINIIADRNVSTTNCLIVKLNQKFTAFELDTKDLGYEFIRNLDLSNLGKAS
jgi:hypothetical protein